ncbi:MAG: neutral/alkaline non-lysosomal ceramidase N-terminal domain-containing protein [Candidatus Bipolaricaulia bacterium]
MANQVKAGVAKAVITPPVGTELWGYARKPGTYTATGIYDDLYVRALVLEPSENAAPIALITLDLGGISRAWADEVRSIVEKETCIPGERVLFSVTHTHAGPAPFQSRGLGTPNEEYLQALKYTTVQTVKDALTDRIPVSGGAGSGRVDLSVNRRKRLLKDLIDQEGPGNVDPYVRVYRLDKQNGQPLALLVNYTAHATTLRRDNRKFSADYPGVMIKTLEEHLGAQAFFLQGTAGNIDPRWRGDYRATQRIGAALAKQVLQINAAIQTHPLYRVSIVQRPALILWQGPPLIEQVKRELEEDQKQLILHPEEPPYYSIPGWRAHRIEWRKSLLTRLQTMRTPGSGPLLSIPVFALVLDDVYWVTLPGEPFVELGQLIQARYHDRPVFVIGYANDTTMGYVFPESAYAEAGYEVDTAFYHYGLDLPVAPGIGEQLVKELMELIPSLTVRDAILSSAPASANPPCPHCDSRHVVKNGRKNGRQRWRCRHCGCTFGPTYGTFLYRLHTSPAEIARTLLVVMQRGSLTAAAKITSHKPRTIGSWLRRAKDHDEVITAALIDDLHLTKGEVDAFWTFVKQCVHLLESGQAWRPGWAQIRTETV